MNCLHISINELILHLILRCTSCRCGWDWRNRGLRVEIWALQLPRDVTSSCWQTERWHHYQAFSESVSFTAYLLCFVHGFQDGKIQVFQGRENVLIFTEMLGEILFTTEGSRRGKRRRRRRSMFVSWTSETGPWAFCWGSIGVTPQSRRL